MNLLLLSSDSSVVVSSSFNCSRLFTLICRRLFALPIGPGL